MSRRFRPFRRPAGPCDAARAFLEGALAGGPLTSQDLWKRVQDEGLAVSTVVRAKNLMGVRSRWVKLDGRVVSYWLLADQDLPAEVRPQTEQDERDVEVGRLLTTDQPHNPLDADD